MSSRARITAGRPPVCCGRGDQLSVACPLARTIGAGSRAEANKKDEPAISPPDSAKIRWNKRETVKTSHAGKLNRLSLLQKSLLTAAYNNYCKNIRLPHMGIDRAVFHHHRSHKSEQGLGGMIHGSILMNRIYIPQTRLLFI